jgi:hypothetical protein
MVYYTNNTPFFILNLMRKLYTLTALLAVTLLSSCELIGDIFKAGAYTGIIIVVIIIAIVIWLISKFRGRG